MLRALMQVEDEVATLSGNKSTLLPYVVQRHLMKSSFFRIGGRENDRRARESRTHSVDLQGRYIVGEFRRSVASHAHLPIRRMQS